MPEGLRLLYGGSFDPIHNGHLHVAREVSRVLATDVHLMPAGDPPHKPPTGANAGQRLQMCRLAVEGVAGLHVDPREVLATGPSYSIATLRALRAEIGATAPVALLVGADSFLSLSRWKDWQALPDLTHFVVAQRPGFDLKADMSAELAACFCNAWAHNGAELQATPAGRVLLLEQPLTPESSSAIRAAIAAGDPHWRAQVPAAVARFIETHQLYTLPTPRSAL